MRRSFLSRILNSKRGKPAVWHVGGVDVDLRIPLLLRLRDAGFDVGAVGSGSPQPFEAAGIPFHAYDLAPGVGPLADLRALRQLRRLFGELRPDIVHAFDTKPGVLVPRAARNTGVRCVRTITGMGRLFSESKPGFATLRAVYRFAQKRADAMCDVTVFQNEDDRRYFLEKALIRSGREAIVRGSGVDVDSLLASVPSRAAIEELRRSIGVGDRFLVLMVSRLVASKGVREFVEAADRLSGERATFVLVGPVDDAERWSRHLARQVRESTNVTYLGKREDVPALLAAADLFVLPTYYREGVPRVLLEAAVMGVPLVSTDVPGCRDVVRDGETGIRVAPRDSRDLAAAVGRMMHDADRGSRLARAAKELVVAEFSLDRVARDYIQIYRSLLERDESPGAPSVGSSSGWSPGGAQKSLGAR